MSSSCIPYTEFTRAAFEGSSPHGSIDKVTRSTRQVNHSAGQRREREEKKKQLNDTKKSLICFTSVTFCLCLHVDGDGESEAHFKTDAEEEEEGRERE